MTKKISFLIFVLGCWISLFAQNQYGITMKDLSFNDFLNTVNQKNVAYLSEKFNLSIVEAQIELAKTFPDPELALAWFDNGERRMKLGYGFEAGMSTTLELGRKRKARMDLAKSEAELAKHLLADFYRNLRAEASISYLVAAQNQMLLKVQEESFEKMNKIAQSDSIRFLLGSITNIDARQSKLEAGTMLNDFFQAEAEWKSSLSQLSFWMSEQRKDTFFVPKTELKNIEKNFVLADLITTAQNNRADLLAATQQKDVAAKFSKLIKAYRTSDLGIGGGISYNSYSSNVIAPTPSFTAVSAGISVPLKLSNRYKGDLMTAYYQQKQAEVDYNLVELTIQNEVVQAYFNYVSLQKQTQQ
ncbi:MAG: TolC family protein, partial [Cytophagales bacterium]